MDNGFKTNNVKKSQTVTPHVCWTCNVNVQRIKMKIQKVTKPFGIYYKTNSKVR